MPGQNRQDTQAQFMDELHVKYNQRYESYYQRTVFDHYNVEVLQHYMDQADWQGAERYNNAIITELDDEVSESERMPLIKLIQKDFAQFLPAFQEQTRPAFEHAFSVAENKPEVKALFHGFQPEEIGRKRRRCVLWLCQEYDPLSSEWIDSKIKKGHPRFKLPDMTINVDDYVQARQVDINDQKALTIMLTMNTLLNIYVRNTISLALCKILATIPNRKIPVGMSMLDGDPDAIYINYL